MKRKLSTLGLVFILSASIVSGCARGVTESAQQACVDSGGTVRTGMCCKSGGDFPDICAVGACGCAPDNSHEVKICDCGGGKCFDGNTCVPVVHSFQDCVEAGYPVMESYPRQCKTPDGRTFTEGEEHCIAPTGESMSLFEAKEIVVGSECGDQLKEPYLEFSVCNADTGTWWIDLDIEKDGCNPACVVDIKTRTAEINWRCLGAEIDWKTYTNERYGYSLRYAPDCTFGPMPGHCKEKPPEERPPECLCFLNAEDPDQVFLQAFTGERDNLKLATFSVSRLAFDPPPGTDLIEYVGEKFPHYEEIPNEPNAKVGGIPAVMLYTPPSPQAFSMEEIYFIKDDKLFRIFMNDVDEKANRELYDRISSALDISVETP